MAVTQSTFSVRQGKNEKRELVRRILRAGGAQAFEQAVDALYDYMREKDSTMPRRWCVWYVCNVRIAMDKKESNDEADNESD